MVVYLMVFRQKDDWYLAGTSTDFKDSEEWMVNAVGKNPFVNETEGAPLTREDIKLMVLEYKGVEIRFGPGQSRTVYRVPGESSSPTLAWADEKMDPMLKSSGRLE